MIFSNVSSVLCSTEPSTEFFEQHLSVFILFGKKNPLIFNIKQTTSGFSCVPYVPDPENTNLLKTAMGIYRKFDKYPESLRCAIQLNDMATVEEIFSSCKDL